MNLVDVAQLIDEGQVSAICPAILLQKPKHGNPPKRPKREESNQRIGKVRVRARMRARVRARVM